MLLTVIVAAVPPWRAFAGELLWWLGGMIWFGVALLWNLL